MKSYLLLGISVLLLLFTLPKPSHAAGRWGSPEQSVLKKACDKEKPTPKRTCRKKCLTHQAHSSSENSAGAISDCGSPIYALVVNAMALPAVHFYPKEEVKGNHLAMAYLPPLLEQEPNPPRFS